MVQKYALRVLLTPLLLTLFVTMFSVVLFPVIGSCAEESPVAPPPVTVENVEVHTPMYRVTTKDYQPPLGTYHFTVDWQGIPAAEASLRVMQEGSRFKVVTFAKTYSGIDLLFKMRYRAEGLLSAADFTPQKSVVEHQENSRFRYIKIDFDPRGTIESVRAQTSKGKEEEFRLSIERTNFTLEPISAVFMARGLPWQVGKSYSFDTFNGKSRYLLTLTAEDETVIEVNKVKRPVWVISPTVVNLVDPNTQKKLRKASIYLSKDDSREILRISSEVFVGSVNVELDSFEPEQTPSESELQFAENVRAKYRIPS